MLGSTYILLRAKVTKFLQEWLQNENLALSKKQLKIFIEEILENNDLSNKQKSDLFVEQYIIDEKNTSFKLSLKVLVGAFFLTDTNFKDAFIKFFQLLYSCKCTRETQEECIFKIYMSDSNALSDILSFLIGRLNNGKVDEVINFLLRQDIISGILECFWHVILKPQRFGSNIYLY